MEEFLQQAGPLVTPEIAGTALVELVQADAANVAPAYLRRAAEAILTQPTSRAGGSGCVMVLPQCSVRVLAVQTTEAGGTGRVVVLEKGKTPG